MSDPTPPAGTPTPRTPGGSKRWQPPAPEGLQALLPADYVIEKLLGKGGMGAVYQGRRLSLDRPVAIKILSNDLDAADASFAERFKNEARAMAQLSHPGIVAVYGFGETSSGLRYIVMEFIAGTDVHRMITEQGRLRTEHAMAITAHVCDALAYAHESGIIHRDIKPANIMVGYDGVVKVADFGLAKMTVDGATLGLTKSGMAMGTLHYMAPEALILGTAVDHRADIYAVGVMLYQMLTGKLPQGVVDPPSEQVPGLDPRFDAIITKAMSEDRDERYQSVRELRRDLDSTLTKPVVKVAAEAAQAPAALTTTARPQRPAGQANHSPLEKINALYAGLSFHWRVGLMLGCSGLVLGGGGLSLVPATPRHRIGKDILRKCTHGCGWHDANTINTSAFKTSTGSCGSSNQRDCSKEFCRGCIGTPGARVSSNQRTAIREFTRHEIRPRAGHGQSHVRSRNAKTGLRCFRRRESHHQ